jgi:tetratricopeptide (TPR) repeat protein
MAENADAIVQAGIRAYKAGNKDEARALLLKATDIDQYNEDAWLWLSGLLESPEEQRQCLENVLVINPANERARKGLDHLLGKAKPAPPPAPEPPPAPRASSVLSTSVEWAAPEESVPTTGRAFTSDPGDVDYDAWVSDLNIATPQRSTMPFATDNVTFDDDALTQGPFGAEAIFTGADDDSSFEPLRTARRADDEDEVSLPSEANAALDAVSAALAAPPPAPLAAAPLAVSAAKASSPFDGIDLDVGDFGKEETDAAAGISPRDARKARREAEKAAKAAAKAEREAKKTAYLPESKLDPQSRAVIQDLQVIPREIEPTRLPGTRERQPILLVATFILLVLLNIGAAALVINRILVPLS